MRPQGLLLLALLLLLATCGADVARAQTPLSLKVAISGSTYLWQSLMDDPTASAQIMTAFQIDLDDAVNDPTPTATIVVADAVADKYALWVEYTATPIGSATQQRIEELVFASTLPTVNGALSALEASPHFANFVDLFLSAVKPTVPLPVNPSPGPVQPVYVTITHARVAVLFSGTMDRWNAVLAGPHAALTLAIEAAACASFSRPEVTDKCTVVHAAVQAPDPKKESFGPGESGLYVVISVEQKATALAFGVFATTELVSLLDNMDTAAIGAVYGSPVTVVAVRKDGNVNPGCGNTCKGMIAMGAVAGGLMIVTFIVVAIIACCCCNGGSGVDTRNHQCQEEAPLVASPQYSPTDYTPQGGGYGVVYSGNPLAPPPGLNAAEVGGPPKIVSPMTDSPASAPLPQALPGPWKMGEASPPPFHPDAVSPFHSDKPLSTANPLLR